MFNIQQASNIIDIISLQFNKTTKSIDLKVNPLVISIILGVTFIIVVFLLIYNYFIKRSKKTLTFDIELNLPFKLGSYKVVRNYENLEIANKIYIELITRKAAIPIDEENDVIYEVYGSWYNLFKITREEIKNIPGKLLSKKNASSELVRLVSNILNDGLRPHLTKYQAAFRLWYEEELKNQDSKRKTPQEVQKEFFINDELNYKKLIDSMKEVNKLLIKYAEELKKFIYE